VHPAFAHFFTEYFQDIEFVGTGDDQYRTAIGFFCVVPDLLKCGPDAGDVLCI